MPSATFWHKLQENVVQLLLSSSLALLNVCAAHLKFIWHWLLRSTVCSPLKTEQKTRAFLNGVSRGRLIALPWNPRRCIMHKRCIHTLRPPTISELRASNRSLKYTAEDVNGEICPRWRLKTQRPDTGMCFQNSYSKCSEAPANQHTCKYDANNMLIAAAVQSERVPANAVSGFSRTLEDTNTAASLLVSFSRFPFFCCSLHVHTCHQRARRLTRTRCVMPSPLTLLMQQTEDEKIRQN